MICTTSVQVSTVFPVRALNKVSKVANIKLDYSSLVDMEWILRVGGSLRVEAC